jgi:hypothetical protein
MNDKGSTNNGIFILSKRNQSVSDVNRSYATRISLDVPQVTDMPYEVVRSPVSLLMLRKKESHQEYH